MGKRVNWTALRMSSREVCGCRQNRTTTREQEELEEALEVERQESEQRRLFIQKEEELQQVLKRKNKQAFLDELESSDLPVALLLAQHKDRSTQLEMQLEKPRSTKPVTFSTGIKMNDDCEYVGALENEWHLLGLGRDGSQDCVIS
ncbi:CDK-activating kinase assembly factor MAT1 [Microtus ochrogaster]|uniref:CDK-activating kinase assembly factor MAT1 n=1 Tax=Microtus ochrogaster TaxID=79684 RepID=A0A8J6GNG6_MICOH|nr:CDK-activating kinase assembly factor MAT1 [Microtus ochrogaster]